MQRMYLVDDGTLDTVFECRHCEGGERYSYTATNFKGSYDEFLEWAAEDAEEIHVCCYDDDFWGDDYPVTFEGERR